MTLMDDLADIHRTDTEPVGGVVTAEIVYDMTVLDRPLEATKERR